MFDLACWPSVDERFILKLSLVRFHSTQYRVIIENWENKKNFRTCAVDIDNRWQSIITKLWTIDCSSITNINRLIAIDYRFHRLVTPWIEQVSDFVTAVFLRFESLPEAPLPFLRGLNKARRSSRFLDVETEGTSKSARSTALLQRSRRRMRSPMVETPSLANSRNPQPVA